MLDNLLAVIQEEGLSEQLYHSLVGIEVEEHRIDAQGRLSQRPYPAGLGSRTFHPYLQTDFSETQSEVITDPNPNISGTLNQLDTLQTVLYRSLEGDDMIWPLSMPPKLSPEDIQSVETHFNRPAYQGYRDHLLAKYGVAHSIQTGVHVNYSIPDPVIHRLYTHYQMEFETVVAFKNALYFRIVQNYALNQWLMTYLFGASPIAETGFFTAMPEELAHPVRSIRNSHFGFTNRADEIVSYESLPAHLQQIKARIAAGDYYSESEFYGPVRIKGQDQLDDYLRGGIRYLELRGIDNTPFNPNGVSRHAMAFLKFFMIYLLTQPLASANIGEQLTAARVKNDQVALESPTELTRYAAEGTQIFHDLLALVDQLHAHTEQRTAIEEVAEVISHPELTPAAKLVDHIHDRSLLEFGRSVATAWKKQRLTAGDLLPAMSQLTPGTQRLVLEAIREGVRYYVVRDEAGDDLLMLTFDGVTQVLPEKEARTAEPMALLHQLFPDLPQPPASPTKSAN